MPFNQDNELVTPLAGTAPPKAPAIDMDDAYKTWAGSPRAPGDNAMVLKAMGPTIDRAMSAQVKQVSPLVRSRARRIALEALGSYNPAGGARLQSHLYNHMQGLKRYAGQISQGVAVPERVTLDRRAMEGATRDLADELGRDPNDDELADRVGLSPQRLRYVRTYSPAMSTGFFATLGEEGGGGFEPSVKGQESDGVLRLVYEDLPPHDKLIFEHTLGWNGKPVKENRQIAAMLRRSPTWVSLRKAEIQKQIESLTEMNPL